MKPILRSLLSALAVGLAVTPLAAQPVARQTRPAHRGVQQGPIRGSIHYYHGPPPYTTPSTTLKKPGIMPAYVHAPSDYGPPPPGYGVYPNIRYFRRHGHVYAHDFTTGTTYLVQW